MNKRLFFVFTIVFVSFVLISSDASAEDFYFFRIDTEIDVPAYFGSSGATVTWRCNGTGYGIVTDGTASESTNLLDGIIKVASTSAENNASHAGCDGGEAITATASFSGWVNELWSDTVSAVGPNVTFTTRASMDYTIVINGIVDELGSTLTLNGTTASATYSSTVASQSYSGGKRYVAASASGGTVTGGADGYVNRTSSALTVSSTASQSVDFGTTDNSTLNESGLLFGVKATLNGTNRHSVAVNNITGATVKAGNNAATSCTDNSDGKYYCAIPLSHTGTTAQATSIPQGFSDANCAYTDRTTGGDAQSTCTIAATEPNAGGGGTPISAPTPTPTPTPEPTPTSIPEPTPQVESVKLYRKDNDPKVYVQIGNKPLQWVRTLEEFNQAGYKWEDVQVLNNEELLSLPIEASSLSMVKLFRKVSDPKVYVKGDDGVLRWIKTAEEFVAGGYDWADVKEISGDEFAAMRVGGKLRVISNIGYLRIRNIPSLESEVVGRVLSDEEYDFSQIDRGWYKILKEGQEIGWVFGEFISEI